MDIGTVGLTISTAGELLLGVAVIMVHRKVLHEHHIDKAVEDELRREQFVAIFAIILILLGYLIQAGFIF